MAKKKPAKKSSGSKKKAAKKPVRKKPAAKKPAKKATKRPGGKGAKKAVKKKAAAKKAVKKKAVKKAAKKSAKRAAKKTAKKPAKKVVKRAAKQPAKKAAPKKAKANKAVAVKPSSRSAGIPSAPVSRPAAVSRPRKRHIPEIDRPTGMYGGVMLSDSPKPFPKTSPYSKGELKQLREALAAEQTRLRRELASLEDMAMGGRDRSDDTTRFPAESSEYSADMQAAETLLGVRTLEEERLEQVTEALERIEGKGHYGLCLACGNKIGIDRLIAKPHAHLCMDCRRLFERRRSQEGF